MARVAAVLAASALAHGALAQDDAGALIYQQRTADGRILLTDRPLAGATTQRRWQAAPVDEVAARQRREAARLEALAVTERIARQLEAEREQRLALERVQLAAARTRVVAEEARADAYAASPAIVFVPVFARRHFAHHAPHKAHTGPPRARPVHQPARFGMQRGAPGALE